MIVMGDRRLVGRVCSHWGKTGCLVFVMCLSFGVFAVPCAHLGVGGRAQLDDWQVVGPEELSLKLVMRSDKLEVDYLGVLVGATQENYALFRGAGWIYTRHSTPRQGTIKLWAGHSVLRITLRGRT